jgi:hypothetical protein
VRARACRCGARLDAHGRCTHCDYPAPGGGGWCARDCVFCRERDSHCVVCKARMGTPAGAGIHETACRDQERRRETKK